MRSLFIILLFILQYELFSQRIESFPTYHKYLPKRFSKDSNIFFIAFLDLSAKGIKQRIPVVYSLFHYSIDSSYFTIKGDNIDNFSFLVSDKKAQPLYKKDALKLPKDYEVFLRTAKKKFQEFKREGDLRRYFRFYSEPDWLQDDKTPFSANGKPMRFICQIELLRITDDDCTLYIFYDEQKKIVKHIIQRT